MRFAFSLLILIFASSVFAAQGTPPQPTTPVHTPHKRHYSKVLAAREEPRPIGILASLGGSAVWQNASDGRSYDIYGRFAGRLGYSFYELFDVFAEYGTYGVNSDSQGNISIKYHHDDYLIWIRKMFFDDQWWGPFAAIGLGGQQETVTTTFNGASVRDTGKMQVLGALAGGLHLAPWISIGPRYKMRVHAIIEARLSTSAGLKPNPAPSLGAHLEFNF